LIVNPVHFNAELALKQVKIAIIVHLLGAEMKEVFLHVLAYLGFSKISPKIALLVIFNV
jgi:hypothetical protein